MSETPDLGTQIPSLELIRCALDEQVKAITGYEEIISKISSGYVVILYSAVTLLLGKEGLSNRSLSPGNALCILVLIFGLSLSVFLIDFGYVRKKLKIVAARDRLMELAFAEHFNSHDIRVEKLLRIAGE